MSSAATVPKRDHVSAYPVFSLTLAASMGNPLDENDNSSLLSRSCPEPQHQQMLSPREVPCAFQGDMPQPAKTGANATPSFHLGTVKKKRNRKRVDKRFDCDIQGCGKSYSRAEHLSRHQLNHSTSQTFRCEFPACSRTFVRGDLLKRHVQRHALRSLRVGQGQLTTDPPRTTQTTTYTKSSHFEEQACFPHKHSLGDQPLHKQQACEPYTTVSNPSAEFRDEASCVNSAECYRHESTSGRAPSRCKSRESPAAQPALSVPAARNTDDTFGQSQTGAAVYSASVELHAAAPALALQDEALKTLSCDQYSNEQGRGHACADSCQSYEAITRNAPSESIRGAPSEMMALDQMGMPGVGPVFGDDGGLNKFPSVGMPEGFMAYLFDALPSSTCPVGPAIPTAVPNYGDLQKPHYTVPILVDERAPTEYFPIQAQQVMAVHNLLHQSAPQGNLSEDKSNEIFSFIKNRFHENDVPAINRRREVIMGGDRNQDHHPLSRRMMQTYMCSYWYYFSDQMPILHQPTFSSDQAPNLLILAMMALGAAYLDKVHEQSLATTSIDVADFIARNLRWEIFMDWSFRPPAKLWVFQALILLEMYEKMCSTRELHERAHIHHATTITLMRRGRSLIGKTTGDSLSTPPEGQSGSKNAFAQGSAYTADEWWDLWIVGEATRRAAFAAFTIDTTHATMFGHSCVMFAHELRLALPCDEALWRAKSCPELARIKSNLLSQGFKPMSFLEGLRRTLGHQEVRTTSFGRTVLMAGLLSVTHHMHQRDLQVNILGGRVSHPLGGRDKWRATLTAAYDSLNPNSDGAREQSESSRHPYPYDAASHEFNIAFASRAVLYHLAHMAMHVDIVDCQIFARAKRLLGRTIGPAELDAAQRRIKDSWAPSAEARNSTFYALKFLRAVLLPGADGGPSVWGQLPGRPYEARYDLLMNRPWVLYYAALIVWCYGFALEGPVVECRRAMSPHQVQREMRSYLLHFGSVEEPSQLHSRNGANMNTALLMVLKESFENTRWDLLHEAASLLDNCIKLNSGVMVM